MVDGICGGDWERIRSSYDLTKVHALEEQWAIAPPMRRVLAAYAGWKPKPQLSKAAEVYQGEDLANYLAAFPGGQQVPAT